MTRLGQRGLVCLVAIVIGCEEIPDRDDGEGGGGSGSPVVEDPLASGTPFDVPTSAQPTYVDLDTLALVTAEDAWDLRFEGRQIFTNGGVSGMGEGAAFGPLDIDEFAQDSVPADIPFLFDDEEGGAFSDWYAYDSTNHVLYSRFHVYGVRRGDKHYKLQILGYYGEAEGAPVSALYRVRSAEVTVDGIGETRVSEVDGTAGGTEPGEDDPSGCIRLETGEVELLTPAEAEASTEWDLCFRRANVNVNGAAVDAVDLMLSATADEALEEVMERTDESELPEFDAVARSTLTDETLEWVKDGAISVFSGAWLVAGSDPLEPEPAAWLVAGSDGIAPFFVAFETLDGATATSVGTVRMRVKPLGGSLP